MKMLFTNNELTGLGGSQTFVYTLASHYRALGHEVEIYSPTLGYTAQKFEEAGLVCLDHLDPGRTYDIIHAQHTPAQEARITYPATPMVYVCHGTTVDTERPSVDLITDLPKLVAMSEGIRKQMVTKWGAPYEKIEVVPNPIDTNRYRPIANDTEGYRPIKADTLAILAITNHPECELLDMLGILRKQIPISLKHIGFDALSPLGCDMDENMPFCNIGSVWNTEDFINAHDIIIGVGRSALEGMSCGKPVIVFNHGVADGVVTAENAEKLHRHNFSGFFSQQRWSGDDLAQAVMDILAQGTSSFLYNRIFVRRYHNVVEIAHRFLQIYNSVATGQSK